MRSVANVPTVLAETPCKTGDEWRRRESNPRTTPTAIAPPETVERRRQERFVYFIQAGTDGPIKIGIADDPARRLRELQTAHYDDLRLLAAIPGNREVERRFHEALAEERLSGEWFTASSRLLDLIASIEQIRTAAGDLAAEDVEVASRRRNAEAVSAARETGSS